MVVRAERTVRLAAVTTGRSHADHGQALAPVLRAGDETANELVEWFNSVDATYRGDLREVNELKFARFDAKQERRFAEYDVKLEQRFAENDVKLKHRCAAIDARFGALEVTLVRWMFVYWTGTMLVLAGFVAAVLRLP